MKIKKITILLTSLLTIIAITYISYTNYQGNKLLDSIGIRNSTCSEEEESREELESFFSQEIKEDFEIFHVDNLRDISDLKNEEKLKLVMGNPPCSVIKTIIESNKTSKLVLNQIASKRFFIPEQKIVMEELLIEKSNEDRGVLLALSENSNTSTETISYLYFYDNFSKEERQSLYTNITDNHFGDGSLPSDIILDISKSEECTQACVSNILDNGLEYLSYSIDDNSLDRYREVIFKAAVRSDNSNRVDQALNLINLSSYSIENFEMYENFYEFELAKLLEPNGDYYTLNFERPILPFHIDELINHFQESEISLAQLYIHSNNHELLDDINESLFFQDKARDFNVVGIYNEMLRNDNATPYSINRIAEILIFRNSGLYVSPFGTIKDGDTQGKDYLREKSYIQRVGLHKHTSEENKDKLREIVEIDPYFQCIPSNGISNPYCGGNWWSN